MKSYAFLKNVKHRLSSSADYQKYLLAQLVKSVPLSKRLKHPRAAYLINTFATLVSASPGQKVLCIGCRNAYEIDLFEEAGYDSVIGIDLFSVNPRIKVMDMHCIEFADNTFDVVYTCHSLEHSYDYKKVIAEIIRVVKDKGLVIVEVPLHFTATEVDVVDFGSVDKLLEAFQPHVGEVVFSEEEIFKENDEHVGRIIIRVRL